MQSSGQAPVLHIALVAAIGLVLVAPLVWRFVRRCFDPFEPFVFFVVAYGVMFVVRPSAMMVTGDLVFEGPRGSLDISGTFAPMLGLALVGAIAFVVGYLLPVGKDLASRLPAAPDPRSFRSVLVLAAATAVLGAISFAAILLAADGSRTIPLLFRGRTPELGEAVRNTSLYASAASRMLVPAGVTLVALVLWRRTPVTIVAAGLGAAVVLLRAVPVGSRSLLLPFVGGCLVLWYLHRRTRPSLPSLLALAVLALVASAFLSDLRGRATRDEGVAETAANLVSEPSRVVAPLTEGPDSQMAPALAAALDVIPERRSFTYGETIFGDLFVRPVPRALWSGKPLAPREELTSLIWPVEYQRGTINPEFSALLYFYWDFWFLGAFIGFTLYGLLARLLYEWFLLNRYTLMVQIVFALLVWFIVSAVRDSPVDLFVALVFTVLPVWIIFWTAARLKRTEELHGNTPDSPSIRWLDSSP